MGGENREEAFRIVQAGDNKGLGEEEILAWERETGPWDILKQSRGQSESEVSKMQGCVGASYVHFFPTLHLGTSCWEL